MTRLPRTWPTAIIARPRVRPTLQSIGVGLGLVALALLAKGALNGWSGEDVAYLPFFALLPISVIAGGFLAGATMVLVGAVLDVLVFQPPSWSFEIQDEAAAARLAIFIPVALWLAWLVAAVAEARSAAADSALRFRRLVDALPDATFVVDPSSWRVEYLNGAAARIASASGDPSGRSLEDILPGVRPILDGPSAPLLMTTVGGGERAMDVTARTVELPSGGSRVLVTGHDLTERIDAEVRLTRLAAAERAQAQMLSAVIGSMDEGVALLAADDRVLVANDGINQVLGVPVATRADLERALGVPLDDGDHRLSDPARWIRIVSRPLGQGPDASRLVVVRDIEAEVEAAATRDAFLGVLSHELRTPVTTILGYSHVLRRGRSSDRSTAEVPPPADLVDDIAAEAERLHHLIEDLLVLSRAQVGAVVFEAEPVLIQHAIREVVAAERARYPHVTFDVRMPGGLPPVSGDRTFVAQVLRNLVGNAAKYAPATPSTVAVVALVAGAEVEVRVLDEGPGFDPAERDQLFEIFYRAERTARRRSGSGIGLYVTRTLVEAMGGRVWADLRPEGGSEFGFRLPVAAADEVDTA